VMTFPSWLPFIVFRMVRLCRNTVLSLGVVLIMFFSLNFAAYFALPYVGPPVPNDLFDAVWWPSSGIGQQVLKEIFGTADVGQAIRYNDASPSFSVHPSLNFITEPIRNEYFSMGVEGVRLEPGWDDNFVLQQLENNRHLIFALGGSTMLGHGVGADHALPYYMNKASQSSGSVILNLGAQAYDQQRAIEKLVYLLQGGFRPEQVIFLDGWNDIQLIARSNLRGRDKLIYHGFTTNRGEIAFTPGGRIGRIKFLNLFLESLPAYRLLRNYQRRSFSINDIVIERDAFTQGFDFYEAEFVFFHWATFAERHHELLKREALASFAEKLKFLRELSKGFNFKVYSFYQPIGLLDPDNPFVSDRAREAPGYAYVVEMDHLIREAIASGKLPMIDLSQTLRGISDKKYVDVAHYSPLANEVLAGAIQPYIHSRPTITKKMEPDD